MGKSLGIRQLICHCLIAFFKDIHMRINNFDYSTAFADRFCRENKLKKILNIGKYNFFKRIENYLKRKIKKKLKFKKISTPWPSLSFQHIRFKCARQRDPFSSDRAQWHVSEAFVSPNRVRFTVVNYTMARVAHTRYLQLRLTLSALFISLAPIIVRTYTHHLLNVYRLFIFYIFFNYCWFHFHSGI
jgi:hypothetical protein